MPTGRPAKKTTTAEDAAALERIKVANARRREDRVARYGKVAEVPTPAGVTLISDLTKEQHAAMERDAELNYRAQRIIDLGTALQGMIGEVMALLKRDGLDAKRGMRLSDTGCMQGNAMTFETEVAVLAALLNQRNSK